MDKAELIRRLLATFVVELQDQLRIYNRELLALEREPAGEAAKAAIAVLFRTVHSLKGASRSVEALRLSRACHALEELLAQLRDGKRAVTPDVLAVLFQAADVLEQAGQQLSAPPEARSRDADAALDALMAHLSGVQSLQPVAAATASAILDLQPMAAVAVNDGPAVLAPRSEPPRALEPAARSGSVAPPAPQIAPRPSMAAPLDNPEARSMVRIATRRLDVLLAHAGELAVARRRLEIRRDEVEALHESVAHLRSTFRALRSAQKAQGLGSGNGAPLQLTAAVATDGNVLRQQRAISHTDTALEHLEAELGRVSLALRDDVASLERAAAPLETQVHRARMLRFEEACDGLSRVVRDVAQAAHKQVELVVQGAEVELDRAIVESARLALMHLVRNAIDHGVETLEERVRAGKPARARVTIAAAASGEQVQITVRDDGRGIHPAMLRAEAERRGLTAPEDERELFRLIFAPGFSTAKLITEVSGRGVGLDAVRNVVDELGGEIEVTSEPCVGTTFTLQLPASASTVRALLLQVGTQVFALPSRNVLRLMRVSPSELARTQGREVLKVAAGAPVPLAPLHDVLELSGAQEPAANGKLAVVLVTSESRVAALVVDCWLNEQELVQKPLGKRVRKMRKVSGAALLPTGQIALVLKPNELVQRVHVGVGSGQLAQLRALPKQAKTKRVLLADDSVTTRTLERSILEAAGYEVITAVDGAQAFNLLQERGADVVVSDVEMPNMDGFALTAAIRGSARFRNLPVVLLTALSSESDKARGMQSGADAYLVKRAFDQQLLLETLRQLT